jgi:prepilin-type N-terminal cleavage/methylation domain-containing protein/prepilin-type processing-associated H-X9-DG protein
MGGAFPGRRVGRGFTLVELLVVIAIIALLVTLLMPSLKAAKDSARIAVCAHNLRQIGTALVTYAHEHEKFPNAPSWANPTYMWEVYFGNPAHQVQTTDGWFGLGLLFSSGVLAQPPLLYCPAIRAETFTYPTGWENPESIHKDWTRYDMKVVGSLYRKFGYEGRNEDLRLQDTPSTFTLVTDIFQTWDYSGPCWPHIADYGVNLAFADGHAEYFVMGLTEFERLEYWRRSTQRPSGFSGYSDYYTVKFFEAMDLGSLRPLQDLFPF